MAATIGGLATASAARGLHIPGATYSGTHSGGGTVEFTVAADGSVVTSFEFTLLPDGCNSFSSYKWSGSAGILNDAFSFFPQTIGAASFSGTFSGLQGARGTLMDEAPFCQGNHPTVTWEAMTSSPATADLSVTLTDLPDPMVAGDTVLYTATVANAGPAGALSPWLVVTLPASLTYVSGTADAGSCGPSVGGAVGITCQLDEPADHRSGAVHGPERQGHAACGRQAGDRTWPLRDRQGDLEVLEEGQEGPRDLAVAGAFDAASATGEGESRGQPRESAW